MITAGAIWLVIGGAVLASLLGYCGSGSQFGPWSWPFDLLSHFRAHYLAALAIGLAAALALRQWPAAGLALLGLALNGFEVGRAWWPPPAVIAAEAAAPRLRLVTLNLRGPNRDEASAIAYLRSADADIVALEEVRGHWATALAGLADRLPYQVIEPRADNFGIALLSRYPIAAARIGRDRAARLPWIVAEIDTPLGRLAVSAVHPVPPMGRQAAAARDAAIAEIATDHAAEGLPRLLLGDFNATPWSFPLRRLVAGLELTGSGIAATWPAALGPLGIPIDHILVDPRFRITRRAVGPSVGSDHRPLLVEIVRN